MDRSGESPGGKTEVCGGCDLAERGSVGDKNKNSTPANPLGLTIAQENLVRIFLGRILPTAG